MNWTIEQRGHGRSPVVVHVPHASVRIPDRERRDLLLSDAELALELARMTDWRTDRIAVDAVTRSRAPATVFVNTLSRLVVDPERLVDGTEPMDAVGMGAVYRVTSQLAPLRRPDPAEERRLLDRWFHPYADAFADLVDETLDAQGRVVIVDLHSYPSTALPYERDHRARRPGVCIGADAFHTSDALRDAARRAFAEVTGGVAVNTPFAGTYVPLRHLRRRPQVESVMIELRRDLYQEEPGGERNSGYDDLVGCLARLLDAIAASVAGGSTGGAEDPPHGRDQRRTSA